MPAAHSPFEAHHGDSKLFGDAFKNRVDEKICRSVLKIIEELNTRILDAEYLQCLETKLRFSFSSVVTVVVEMCGEELTNLTTNFIDTLRRCQEHVNNSQSKVPEDLTSMSTSKNSKTTGKSGDAHVEVKEEWIEGVEVDEMDPTDGIICLEESTSHAAVDSGSSAEISIQIVGSSSFVDFEGKSEDKANMLETVVPFGPQRSVKRVLNVSTIQGYAANEISTEASNLIHSTNTSRKRKFRHSDVGEDDSADDGQLNNQGTRQRTSAPITNRMVISTDNSEEDDDDNISSDLEENIAEPSSDDIAAKELIQVVKQEEETVSHRGWERAAAARECPQLGDLVQNLLPVSLQFQTIDAADGSSDQGQMVPSPRLVAFPERQARSGSLLPGPAPVVVIHRASEKSGAPDQPVPRKKKFGDCPVCERRNTRMACWQCRACKSWWERLVNGSAKLSSATCYCPEYTAGCSGCRRRRYEEEFVARNPRRLLPLQASPAILMRRALRVVDSDPEYSVDKDVDQQRGGECVVPGERQSERRQPLRAGKCKSRRLSSSASSRVKGY